MGVLGETEAVILELGYDRSDQSLLNRCRTTLKIAEPLGDLCLECDPNQSHRSCSQRLPNYFFTNLTIHEVEP